MRIAVISRSQREEWKDKEAIEWVDAPWAGMAADAIIDLDFEPDAARIDALKKTEGLVIVNSNLYTVPEIGEPFVRINGWPGCLKQAIEAYAEADQRQRTEAVFTTLGATVEWLPDVHGFITPRVVSMIINEAFFALAEGVSTKQEIDTAMKLGTAYPYGPFEWAEKIGLQQVHSLLQKLSKVQPRYTPAELLTRSVND